MTPRRAVAALVLATVLGVASCSTSVSSDSSPSTQPDDAATTTVDGATTTTAEESPPVSIGAADLEALLPTADEVGDDFRIDPPTDDEDSPIEELMEESCPALAEFEQNDEEPVAEREFIDDDEVEVSVSISDGVSTSPVPDPESLEKLVEAIEGCDEMLFTQDGVDYSVVLGMERDDSFGDYGVNYTMDVTLASEDGSETAEFGGLMQMYVMDDIRVVVNSLGWFDGVTLETIDPDLEAVDRLASRIEGDLEELLGG